VDEDAAITVFETPEQRDLARTIAQKSLVLLKNNGDLLPLAKTTALLPSLPQRRQRA